MSVSTWGSGRGNLALKGVSHRNCIPTSSRLPSAARGPQCAGAGSGAGILRCQPCAHGEPLRACWPPSHPAHRLHPAGPTMGLPSCPSFAPPRGHLVQPPQAPAHSRSLPVPRPLLTVAFSPLPPAALGAGKWSGGDEGAGGEEGGSSPEQYQGLLEIGGVTSRVTASDRPEQIQQPPSRWRPPEPEGPDQREHLSPAAAKPFAQTSPIQTQHLERCT